MTGTYWTGARVLLASPHLLIAGTTGSGKTTAIYQLVNAATYSDISPHGCSFALFDPKRVSLNAWKRSRFCACYECEPQKILERLRGCVVEMMRRYKYLETTGADEWQGPRLYVVIDELADLLLTDKRREFIQVLTQLLALGRAAGVCCILATQCPSRKILPAEILLNCPARLGLRCLNPIESRQIIGVNGCEDLPRFGFGLIMDADGIRRINIPLMTREDFAGRA